MLYIFFFYIYSILSVNALTHPNTTHQIITIPATESYTQRLTSSSHQTYHRYQTIIHHDPPHKPSPKQFTRFLVNSPLFNNEHCVQSFCAAASGANNNKSNVSKENNTNQSPPSSAASSSSFSSKVTIPIYSLIYRLRRWQAIA